MGSISAFMELLNKKLSILCFVLKNNFIYFIIIFNIKMKIIELDVASNPVLIWSRRFFFFFKKKNQRGAVGLIQKFPIILRMNEIWIHGGHSTTDGKK